jgi:hypothetical protein
MAEGEQAVGGGVVMSSTPFADIEGFDQETLRNMTQAFHAACDRLRLDDDDAERADLADEILKLAARGERDPGRLYALALEAFDMG